MITDLGRRELRLDELVRYPGNARVHDEARLRAAVRQLGQYRSICGRRLDDGTVVILGGNGTADAMAAEGHETARVDVIGCDDTEAEIINVWDNRSNELAQFDLELLQAQVSHLATISDAALGLAGYTGKERDALDRYLDGLRLTGDDLDSWDGLPDFDQPEKLAAYRTIVHFPTDADADRFFELIEQSKAKVVWFPDDGHKGDVLSHRIVVANAPGAGAVRAPAAEGKR